MDHIAIMQKSWGLTEKIVTGQKAIESRWYKGKYAPWGRSFSGDTIYFKSHLKLTSRVLEQRRLGFVLSTFLKLKSDAITLMCFTRRRLEWM
jgi:hypothetical protein